MYIERSAHIKMIKRERERENIKIYKNRTLRYIEEYIKIYIERERVCVCVHMKT